MTIYNTIFGAIQIFIGAFFITMSFYERADSKAHNAYEREKHLIDIEFFYGIITIIYGVMHFAFVLGL